MLTLHCFANSRSLRAAWTLEELGLDYRCRHVDLAAGAGQREDHLALHPDGKVPVLVDDDLTLFESLAICRYLADRYGAGRLLPEDTAGRAQVDQWLSFTISELEQPLWTLGKHRFALPEARRVPAILPTAEWEFQRALGALARRFDGSDWLVRGTFSLADIFVGHTLSWAQAFQQPLPAALDAYRERCMARPALAAARAREAELTPAE
ncbi:MULTISPECIES: glutathione S-transferase family protein [unclassified Modicisalibacter]|uniref:glutathione S-transferase family protein n=1 Tax=unclassified Modicisalibacter TaxID=2679913 RepID=UPI001CCABA57|nr:MULTISPECIES: glutathione S-transferase family protein [unclassified Modicisalibacter]MBZ9558444.1 glutathione S-transferase family protein [Modicisalibacter sp. R2A 31.J]MBZ9575664.1 glutathione S-transferase family protein [Modicisalibacter sp. MOD 31.J]